jgi:hypothetical protein
VGWKKQVGVGGEFCLISGQGVAGREDSMQFASFDTLLSARWWCMETAVRRVWGPRWQAAKVSTGER